MYDNFMFMINTPYILYPLVVWSVFWKGWALWRTARLNQVGWYIALIVINTLSIFEIIYIIVTWKRYDEAKGCVR